MAGLLVLQNVDTTRRRNKRDYKITFSGSYTTAGETLDFTAATNPNNKEAAKWGRIPTGYAVENFPAGYKAEIVPGTLLTNWKIKIWDNAAGTELAQAAYPAAISGSTSIRLSFDGPIGV